jgi:type IV secretion system protein VirB1
MGPVMLLSGFLSLCTTCGPGVHPATTQAIIEVESAGNHLAIHDNISKSAFKPSSKEEAIKIASHLIAQGHSVDMGLMQINSQHLKKKDLDLEQLFEPCYNIKTGTKILADFYNHHRRNNPNEPDDIILLKALSSYNTGTPYNGKSYVSKILRKAGRTGIKDNTPMLQRFANMPIIRSIHNAAFFRKESTP